MEPLLDISGLIKDYQGLRPLRIARLTVRPADVLSIGGLDAAAAERFVHLITGATLPDAGEVTVFGQNTRAITDSEAWLNTLDGIGMISPRGILIESFSVLQNIAMSLTLEVGLFTQVTGLSAQVDVMEYPEGGINTFVHRLPTRIKQGNITLKRGVTKEKALIEWFQKTVVKVQPADLSINVLDETGNTVQAWSFRNAYPVKWTGSDLNASGNEMGNVAPGANV